MRPIEAHFLSETNGLPVAVKRIDDLPGGKARARGGVEAIRKAAGPRPWTLVRVRRQISATVLGIVAAANSSRASHAAFGMSRFALSQSSTGSTMPRPRAADTVGDDLGEGSLCGAVSRRGGRDRRVTRPGLPTDSTSAEGPARLDDLCPASSSPGSAASAPGG